MRIFALAGAAALAVGIAALTPISAHAASFGTGTAVSSVARDHMATAFTQVADKKPAKKKAKKVKKP